MRSSASGSTVKAALGDLGLHLVADAADGARGRARHGVGDQYPVPRDGGDLGDARAHRARADHANRPKSLSPALPNCNQEPQARAMRDRMSRLPARVVAPGVGGRAWGVIGLVVDTVGGGLARGRRGHAGAFRSVDADRVAGEDGRGGVFIGHEPGDGPGVGRDAGDAGPVGAEDHPPGEPAPVLPGVVVAQPGRRQAGKLDPDPVVDRARNAAASYHQPRPPCARTRVSERKSRSTSSRATGSPNALDEPGKVEVPQCTTTGTPAAWHAS